MIYFDLSRIPGMLGYLARMWSCRYFWLSLVRVDLQNRYRRSILGVGWSLVRPIAFTVILCVVFAKLFKRGDTWSYAPYLLAGLAYWDYLTTATKQGCQCFFQGESFIRQHPAPVAIFPLRTALTETFHFLVSLSVLFVLSFLVRGIDHWPVLLSLIPTLGLLFLMVWSLAMLAGFANVYFQDTQHLCDVVFQILFYLTPIVYEVRDLGEGRIAWIINHCNPLLPFLRLMREPLLEGRVPEWTTYLQATTLVLLLGSSAILICSRLQKQLIFRL